MYFSNVWLTIKRMRNYLAVVPYLFLFVAVHASDGISVHAFITENTYFYPEVNLLVSNATPVDRRVIVTFSFGGVALLTNRIEDCKTVSRSEQAMNQAYLADIYSSDIGKLSWTGGVVPKNGQIHRSYVFGLHNMSYPCFFEYTVTDSESHKVLDRGGLALNEKFEAANGDPPDEGSLTISHVAEKVIRKTAPYSKEFGVLLTSIVKNNTGGPFSLMAAQKKLTGCRHTSFDTSLLPGLDGSVMFVKPLSYAVALTLLYTTENENPECAVEFLIQDTSKTFRKNVRVPIRAIGEYDFMDVPDDEHMTLKNLQRWSSTDERYDTERKKRPNLIIEECNKFGYRLDNVETDRKIAILLSFDVREDGTVEKFGIEESSGFPDLDAAAKEYYEKCKFRPTYKDGKPQASSTKIRFRWTVRGNQVGSPASSTGKSGQAL